jgi:hypothetical protein
VRRAQPRYFKAQCARFHLEMTFRFYPIFIDSESISITDHHEAGPEKRMTAVSVNLKIQGG